MRPDERSPIKNLLEQSLCGKRCNAFVVSDFSSQNFRCAFWCLLFGIPDSIELPSMFPGERKHMMMCKLAKDRISTQIIRLSA